LLIPKKSKRDLESGRKIIKVPNLRFPEFSEGWETERLGEIAMFSKGKGISKSDVDESGVTECIRYGELYTQYGEVITKIVSKTNLDQEGLVLSEVNDVIIPSSGETQIDIATASCVLKTGVALGGDLNIIKTSNNGIFLSYYLNSKKRTEIANLAQGVSVVHLYSNQLASLEINLPSLFEQNKIATFLSLLDERIQTQSKVIAQLKSLMQSLREMIFKQQLQFKDDFGNNFPNWEVKKLRDIFSISAGGDIQKINTSKIQTKIFKYPIYANSEEKKGLYGYSDLYKVEENTITVTGRGNIGIAIGRNHKYYPIVRLLVLKPKLEVSIIFFENQINLLNIYKESTGVPQLTAPQISTYFVKVPCLDEQLKIAKFLSSFDEKINAEKQLLQQYENQKKYLLQNLFI